MKYFLLIFILLPQLHAFTITQDDIDYEKFPLEVFTDTTNKLTIDSVKNADFNNALSKESYGYKRGKTFWLRFTLKNQSSKDQELYLYHKDAYSYLNVVFYELQAGRLLKTLNLSRNIPMESKQIKDSSPVYVVTLKKGEEKEFYIKNQSRSTMLVNLQLLDAPHYHKANLYKNAFYFFFFGIVISLAIYNLILFASVRAIEYLYYVFFMFGSISYLFYASGVPLEFFGVTGSMFSLLLYGVGVLQAALILFSQKVLETKQHLPKVHRFLNAVFALNFFLYFIALFISINNIITIIAYSSLLYAVILLIVGLIAYYSNIKTSRYYIFSIGSYLVFALIGIMTYLGVFPYTNITRYALFMASLSEVFLLSLLLSHRISILRNRAIESETKLREEVTERNEILFELVKARTAELEGLNTNLEDRVSESIEELRKKDEDLMRQSRMAMMGEMLSMIAHQWRQPLASIASVRNNMQIELELDVMEKTSFLEQLGNIDTYIQFMSKTIEDFRNFFKPERNKNLVELSVVVESAMNIIAPVLNKSNVLVNIKQEKLDEIFTFKNELIQVVLNIVKNAHDIFVEKEIEKPKISIIVKQTTDHQMIIIEDNAGGIDEKIIPNIFDPYFSTKPEKNGTGLGLYMSKIIVEDHCLGHISVANISNGAQFMISFDKQKVAS